ncbi:hypothetical protein AN958_12565 [Leucoagaricus sp. SymC.cos]|nr:hypothetical protein AN958_12565 [Leucoagaricus sp. SymC.cos]
MAYYNNNSYTSFSTDQEALAWAYASSQSASQSQNYSTYATNTNTNTNSAPAQSGSNYTAPIQIVLESSEANSESEEGSTRDGLDGGRRRACERCRKIKVKCEYPPNSKSCLRCANVGLTCVPSQPKQRNPRPRLSAYDSVMEGVGSSTKS